MKTILPHLIILAMIGAGAVSGLLSTVVFELADLSFRIAPRPASGEVVIVAIDRGSLDRLGPWPWPRRYHAKALDRLTAAGAHQIAFDIDLGGRTNATDDQALADAIGRATDGRATDGRATGGRENGGVILPVFKQSLAESTENERQVHTVPYAPFTLGARLGTVNVRLEKDGRARRYLSNDDWKGKTIPSMANLLAPDQTPAKGWFFLDFGIQPKSVPLLPYIDILNGNFREEAIRGKTVIIGAMAAELGDQLPVPIHGALSGPLVHALAFESLVQGRDVYGKTVVFMLVGAFLLSFSAGRLFDRLSGRVGPRTTGV